MANLKKISDICPYCKDYITYPGEDVYMSKTKRKSTILFHGKCFLKNGTQLRFPSELKEAK